MQARKKRKMSKSGRASPVPISVGISNPVNEENFIQPEVLDQGEETEYGK